jgi:hypothetical protein
LVYNGQLGFNLSNHSGSVAETAMEWFLDRSARFLLKCPGAAFVNGEVIDEVVCRIVKFASHARTS